MIADYRSVNSKSNRFPREPLSFITCSDTVPLHEVARPELQRRDLPLGGGLAHESKLQEHSAELSIENRKNHLWHFFGIQRPSCTKLPAS